MSELWSEFESVKDDIVTTKADLAKAKQEGKEDLVLACTNLLNNLYQEKQRLVNSGIVINFSMFLFV